MTKTCHLSQSDHNEARFEASFDVTESNEDKTVSLRIFMPEDVRTKFKSECVLEGISMSEKAVELIQQWLQEKTQSKQKTG
jgi:hypothetical protein